MNRPTERPLTLAEQVELAQELADARRLLPEDVDRTDVDAVAEALRAVVDALREDPKAAGIDIEEAGFLAGILLGDALSRGTDFTWAHLTYDNGFESLGLVSPDRAYVCFPFHFVYELVADRKRENTLPVLWELARSGRTPTATPQAYLPLA